VDNSIVVEDALEELKLLDCVDIDMDKVLLVITPVEDTDDEEAIVVLLTSTAVQTQAAEYGEWALAFI
jgi:hypothetical protein